MASETTHPTLLARVRDPANAAAWREFEARYRDLIRRACRRHGLQAADAEDVCQLVLLALARALQGFRLDPARGRFRDYLGRVVGNAIRRHQASPRETPRLLDTVVLEELIGADDSPAEEAWEGEWMQHHFRLAMRAVRGECTPETLTIFERLLTGESVADVARASGATTEAVHKVKQRVRDRLKEHVERQIRDEEFPASGRG